ncbi:MAG: hypothetical protein AABY64_13180 [Bdellovibrionota bacterium]
MRNKLFVFIMLGISSFSFAEEKTLFLDIQNINCVAAVNVGKLRKEFPLAIRSFKNKNGAFSHDIELAVENDFIQASVELTLKNSNNKYTYDKASGVDGLFSLRTKEILIPSVTLKFVDYCHLTSQCRLEGDLFVMSFQGGENSIICNLPLVE